MNKREKEVQQAFLDNEKAVLKSLERNYQDALAEINGKLEVLMARQDADMAHVIYQIEHQKALKTQVKSILENLQNNEFESISEYLANSYTDGFIGTMYDIHGQGIPLIVPIDQKQVIEAIQHETKLTSKLYDELGLDIKELQKNIAGEISRGIASGQGYPEIARNIANYAKIPKNRAMTIARTESHRIQCKATSDAQFEAKKKGADVVKQWDAALDGDTRPNHRKLDGQIRELEERFEVGKFKPRFPGDFGEAGEDCNCRCALLQRARWALDEAELETLKKRAEYFELDKTKDFEDYKKKYLKASEKSDGLSAKIRGKGIPEHEEPVLLKSIDYADKKAVKKELQNFEKDAIKESVETACVVTKDGEVFKCFGIEDRVFPDFDLGDKLKGASVTHNHPIEKTTYSFSNADMQLFIEYDLDVLRGCDEVYTYEFTRNADDIDEQLIEWYVEENYQHCMMIEQAMKYGIGYRRWKNE